MALLKSAADPTALPWNETITSPWSSRLPVGRAQRDGLRDDDSEHARRETECLAHRLCQVLRGDPQVAARDLPLFPQGIGISFTRLEGIANPSPSEPCPWDMMSEFIPTTSPLRLRRGPPLLPGLMAESVWMKSSRPPVRGR